MKYGNVVGEANFIFTVGVDVNKSFPLCRIPWIEFRTALDTIMKLGISIAFMLGRCSVCLCTTRCSLTTNRICRAFTWERRAYYWRSHSWFNGGTVAKKKHTQGNNLWNIRPVNCFLISNTISYSTKSV
jgi:hypothetical protein